MSDLSANQWRLVPVEPTDAMVNAGMNWGRIVDGRPLWKQTHDVQGRETYRAMLAAAPTPPAESDLERELAALQAQAAELARDAERYRWLRDPETGDASPLLACFCGKELDDAIDEAMGGKR